MLVCVIFVLSYRVFLSNSSTLLLLFITHRKWGHFLTMAHLELWTNNNIVNFDPIVAIFMVTDIFFLVMLCVRQFVLINIDEMIESQSYPFSCSFLSMLSHPKWSVQFILHNLGKYSEGSSLILLVLALLFVIGLPNLNVDNYVWLNCFTSEMLYACEMNKCKTCYLDTISVHRR